jgi:hypothetical protein
MLPLWTYAKAVRRWNDAGRPVRSQQRVREIYERHCRPCMFFNDGHCSICKCHCNTSGVALANKLKMATERCPIIPPRWKAEV